MAIDMFRVLDRFLPFHLLQSGDQTRLMKGRVLVFLSLMYLVSLGSVIVLLTLLGLLGVFTLWGAVLSSLLSFSLYTFQLRYFKYGGDLRRAANIGMSIMVIATACCALLTGGWTSPVMMILLCTPVCAFLMEGKNAGLLWSVAVFVIGCFILLLHVQGIALPQMIDAYLLDYLSYCSWLYGFMIVASGMAFYGSLTEKINTAVRIERQQLKNKATYDALTGVYSRQAFLQRLPQWLDRQCNGKSQLFVEVDIEILHALQREHMEQFLSRCVETLQSLAGNNLILSRSSGSCFQGLLPDVHDSDNARMVLQRMHQQLEALSGTGMTRVTIGAVMLKGMHTPTLILPAARKAIQDARTQGLPYILSNSVEGPELSNVYIDNAVRCRYADLVMGSGKV